MIRVHTEDSLFGTQVKLKFDNGNNLNINYYGDLDLYFTPETRDDKVASIFEINPEEDPILYQMFKDFYYKMVSYKPVRNVEKKFRREERSRERRLIKDGIIEWISDGESIEDGSRMIIYTQNNNICIYMESGLTKDGLPNNTVRVSSNNSRYGNFWVPFAELYDSLCKNRLENHQITIPEYMLSLRVKEVEKQ